MNAFAPIRLAPRFMWPVALGGYRVVEVNIPKPCRSENGYELQWDSDGEATEVHGRKHGDRLVVSIPDGGYEDRSPLEDPALFMNMAKLECSEEAVLKFITRHGMLSYDSREATVRFGYSTPLPAEGDDAESRHEMDERDGHSLSRWYSLIKTLRAGIALWTASKCGSDEDVYQLVQGGRLDLDGVEFDGGSLFGPTHANEFDTGSLGMVFSREDARQAAQQLALARFDGQVIWSFGRALPHNRDVIELTPNSLESGIWLQFAAAMAAEAQFKTCLHCGSFYDASGTRTTKKYCGDSCKTRAWNRAHANKKRGADDGTV